uniref:Cyanophycin synthetase n=1 Tax=uncultured Thiotrichaceae bacterium TaxID=298394 RepID=A0A6S6UFT1_9GAMM|nr:MAG: Cyanophycin synthetase [uncultured Thiotrichaceae bacterium]
MDSDQGQIKLSSQYHAIPGAAYGISQSVLSGEITINKVNKSAFSQVKAFMAEVLEEPLFDCPYENRNQPFVFHILHWSTLMQQQQEIPVFGNSYLREIRKSDNGSITLFVAMPYSNIKCSVQSLVWIVNQYNHLTRQQEPLLSGNNNAAQSFMILQHSFRKYSVKGVNTFFFLEAAKKLNIPFFEALPGTFRLGTGKYLRYIQSTLTDSTSFFGVKACQNKKQTATLLRQAGLPTPKHKQVRNAEQAVKAAEMLGYPLVIKPADRDRGQGVYINLQDSTTVTEAFNAARKHSPNILLEKHQQGNRYRFTVFNGRVISVFFRLAAGVTGDGINTVEELINIECQSPHLRQHFRRTGKEFLILDKEALSVLADSGLTEKSIPDKGQYVALRKNSNISTEGPFIDFSNKNVHPDNINLAIRAARVLSLDFAGVDFITQRIDKSWLETESIICEVNAKPQIADTITPEQYQGILSELMKGKWRIKAHLLIFHPEISRPSFQEITQITQDLQCNAFSTADGVWVNSTQVTGSFKNSFEAARALFSYEEIDAGIAVMSTAEVLRFGLPIDHYNSIRFFQSKIEYVDIKENMTFKSTYELLEKHSSNVSLL